MSKIDTVEAIGAELRKFSDTVAALKRSQEDLEIAFRRGATSGRAPNEKAAENEFEQKAFRGFLRGGVEALEPQERKTLAVYGGDPQGGYLATPTMETDLIRKLTELSPMRQLATVRPGSGPSLLIPRVTSELAAAWLGEIEPAPATQPSFGQLEIPAHRLGAFVEVSSVLLDDSSIDLEMELNDEASRQFAKAEGAAFLVGNHPKRPRGILAYPAGTGEGQVPQVVSQDATTIMADALIKMFYSLKAPYRQNATWIMNADTLGVVRLMKDGTGRYLWDQGNGGLVPGQATTILGRPVMEAPDMPGVAVNSLPIALGDWRRAYRIYDRRALSVIRDAFTGARQGLVRYTMHLRVGGDVVLPEAMVIMRVAAS